MFDVNMRYTPKINDYIRWKKGIEGWVYFVCNDYITIETSVWEKDAENYEHCKLHRNDRVLVLCYRNQWNELSYVKSRSNPIESIRHYE